VGPRSSAHRRSARSITLVEPSTSYVAHFFDGLGMVEPGVVRVQQWRPDSGDCLRGDADCRHRAILDVGPHAAVISNGVTELAGACSIDHNALEMARTDGPFRLHKCNAKADARACKFDGISQLRLMARK
jgi:S-adenosyl methyltransferase